MTAAAIFDLDGTLVDTPRAIVDTFTAAFTAMDAPPQDPAAIRATIGLPLEHAFGKLLGLPVDDTRIAAGVEHYLAFFKKIVLPNARELVFPGVAEGLAALSGEGVALAIATSKFYRSADALLTSAGLREYFTVVVGADQVTRPKPDAETAQVVLGALGTVAERAVMVGDTTHDLLMARAAAMRSIAVTYGVHSARELASAEPTWTAGSFADVVMCLRRAFAETITEGGKR